MKMTKEIANSIAIDEGNRNMRKAGRKAWSEDDYDIAVRKYNEL